MCPDPDAELVPTTTRPGAAGTVLVTGGSSGLGAAVVRRVSPPAADHDPEHEVVDHVRRQGWCLATAESLTGGLVARRLAAAPGSGACFRGGLVAYASLIKHEVLGVRPGPVVAGDAAAEMAAGAARLFGADVAVATTGVAGPDELEGQPVGTVWLAVTTPAGARTERHRFEGPPDQVVAQAADRALALLRAALAAAPATDGTRADADDDDDADADDAAGSADDPGRA